jgi:hypothetical protein
MPVARAFCARIASGFSTSDWTVIMRSANSSTITTTYGIGPSSYGSGRSTWWATGSPSGPVRAPDRLARATAPLGMTMRFPSITFRLKS